MQKKRKVIRKRRVQSMHQDQLMQVVAGSGDNESPNNYNNFNIQKTNSGNNNGETTGNFRDDTSNNK